MTEPSEDLNSNNNMPEISQSSGLEGLQWIGQSFSIFGKNPSIWIVMFVIYFAIGFMLSSVPILVLLPALLAPVFNAGFVFAARAVDQGKKLDVGYLFTGFRLRFRSLFRLGMLNFFLNILIIFMATMFFEAIASEASLVAMSKITNTDEIEKIILQNPHLLVALLKALMFGLVLSIPLIMASWFAPLLVMFHQVTPIQAMILSIKACNRNMLAFLIFGLVMIPLMILSIMPLGLGLLIMLPVIFISQYCSYKAIFNQQENDQGMFLV